MQSLRLTDNRVNITLFLIWWYVPLYYSILIGLTDFQILAFVKYAVFLFIFLYAVYINQCKFPKRFLFFFIIYLLLVSINILFVHYRYEVFIEAIPSFITFITPVYLLSLSSFSLEGVIKRGYDWAIFHTLFTVLSIFSSIGYGSIIIGYGAVASIATANIVILIFGYFTKNIYRKNTILICLIVNFISLGIFGSRMPMVAAVITILFLIIFLNKERKLRHIVSIIVITISTLMLTLNLAKILNYIMVLLSEHGIESRSLRLFVSDIGNKNILEMMYSSGREDIWTTAVTYITDRMGLPGGFGVIRYLTDGDVYFSHNLLLDLTIIIGIFIIPLIVWTILRIKQSKLNLSQNEKAFFATCAVFFLVSSITGAHFLADRYAIISWGILFFYRNVGGANK